MPQTLEGVAGLLGDPDIGPLVEWAKRVGREVANAYGHRRGSQEADDLEASAVAHLVEIAPKFDPARHADCADLPGAFKGFAHQRVHTACVRFADNLRGGGTTKQSVRPANRRTVAAMGDGVTAVAAHRDTETARPEPVSRVRINGTLYAIPFERLLRPLTGQELADLEASIDAHGILDPLTTCVLEGVGPAIIDGGHRGTVATRKGIPAPVNDYGLITYDLAELLARTLNVQRRHLSGDEIKQHKAQQAERMVRMQERGMSLRAIARQEGIDHPTQVNRAIRTAKGVTSVTDVTTATESAACCKALDIVFRKLPKLIELDRDQIVRLAEECDLPITQDSRGAWKWQALGVLTTLRGMLERVT
jgi:hypothetical protein